MPLSLQQGMKQSMVATAAMQMFMRTLQSTSMELQQIATQAMASNPVLEEEPPPPEEDRGTLKLNEEATRQHDLFINQLTEEETLVEHLATQIRQSALPQAIEQAALQLIAHLDPHGYFEEPPESIAAQEQIPPGLLSQALEAVQDLEPAGVGSRGLQESLLLQLQRQGEADSLAWKLVSQRWDDIVRHRYSEAARALGIEERAVSLAAARIARLNPDPGSAFAHPEYHTLEPDLLVIREGDDLSVLLTGSHIPRLRLSADYREMMAERADDPALLHYLSRCFREGRELIKAIDDRQQTILNIARTITEQQREFFLRGPSFLRPLRMEDTASQLGIHISTVSRAVNGKYLHCDYGTYELRRFFTAAVSAYQGEAHSAASIQAKLRALIDAEDPRAPLSDAKLGQELARQGLNVARRTIAKYREQMKILPASMRKIKSW